MEFKARKNVRVAPTGDILQGRASEALQNNASAIARAIQAAGGALPGSGAAEAAGILTAIDEDPEGGEEASCPKEFEYQTDAEDEE